MKRCLTLLLLAGILCQAAETISLSINGRLFPAIEVARTNEARIRGLMFRESLPETSGMLFIMERPQVLSFWMRNTRIPLDIIYLEQDGTIVAIHTMKVEPPQRPGESDDAYCRRLPSYSSNRPALMALELNAGMAAALKLKPGDVIRIK